MQPSIGTTEVRVAAMAWIYWADSLSRGGELEMGVKQILIFYSDNYHKFIRSTLPVHSGAGGGVRVSQHKLVKVQANSANVCVRF